MENRHAVNCRFVFTFFYPQKEKGLFQHTVELRSVRIIDVDFL